jgi:hypothetical protein
LHATADARSGARDGIGDDQRAPAMGSGRLATALGVLPLVPERGH